MKHTVFLSKFFSNNHLMMAYFITWEDFVAPSLSTHSYRNRPLYQNGKWHLSSIMLASSFGDRPPISCTVGQLIQKFSCLAPKRNGTGCSKRYTQLLSDSTEKSTTRAKSNYQEHINKGFNTQYSQLSFSDTNYVTGTTKYLRKP